MCAHVLIAEDDEMQAELLRRYLEHDGHSITIVHNGQAAIDEVRRRQPDLLVLDVMMPEVDGMHVCRVLREESDLPVLMLTALSSEDDLLLGLETGADDYLTKPYSPRELSARVRTLLRRVRRENPDDHVLRVGPITVDPLRREVTAGGKLVECTPGEFEILAAMAAQPERVFSRSQLLERTGSYDKLSTERVVDGHIMNLRRKVEPDPRRPVHLLTVFGVGYKLTDRHAP